MSKDYYWGKGNQKIGPLTLNDIKQRVEEGDMPPDTLVWCEGMADWKPASQVSELADLFKKKNESATQPPPLPQESSAETKAVDEIPPAGLSPMEEKAYRFATSIYRPWKGKDSPLGAYVRKNPKHAVYVSAGTIIFIGAVLLMLFNSFSGDQNQQHMAQQPSQGAMPPAGWQAQHRAMMGAQREIGQISTDAYTYQRDRQDEMYDSYKRATYGTDD